MRQLSQNCAVLQPRELSTRLVERTTPTFSSPPYITRRAEAAAHSARGARHQHCPQQSRSRERWSPLLQTRRSRPLVTSTLLAEPRTPPERRCLQRFTAARSLQTELSAAGRRQGRCPLPFIRLEPRSSSVISISGAAQRRTTRRLPRFIARRSTRRAPSAPGKQRPLYLLPGHTSVTDRSVDTSIPSAAIPE